MKNLCFEESRNDLMNQQLLRNMRVYEVVLDFLSIPYDKVGIYMSFSRISFLKLKHIQFSDLVNPLEVVKEKTTFFRKLFK